MAFLIHDGDPVQLAQHGRVILLRRDQQRVEHVAELLHAHRYKPIDLVDLLIDLANGEKLESWILDG